MKIDATLPIAKIAAEVPGAMAVFESLGIDYSCAGERSLADAAYAEGLDPETLIRSLRGLRAVQRAESWNDRSPTDLVRHLVAEHHRFVRDELAAIALRLADVCSTPGGAHPDLQSLRAAFAKLSDVIIPHLRDEEENVFRAIEAIENAWQLNQPPPVIEGDLHAGILRIVGEHGTIAAQLQTIRELRLRLDASNDLSPRCRPILDGLENLEAHLHEYMFLENCILFPRAVVLQEQMRVPNDAA